MIRVLLFKRDSAWHGGVVNFYLSVLDKFSHRISVKEFRVGRRRGIFGGVTLPFQFFIDAIKLAILLAGNKYHVHHLNPSLDRVSLIRDGVMMLILRVFRRKSIIVFIRGWDEALYEKISRSRWRKKLFHWVFGEASLILVLGKIFSEKLISLGISKELIEITSTTFDGTIINGVNTKSNKGEFVLILLARLIKEKGIFETIDAVKLLREEGRNVRLVLAGMGPALGDIKERIRFTELEDFVELPGYLRGKEKGMALSKADVFVLPTYHGEGCPNALLEAMGTGLPIISTPVGGIPDIMQSPENGTLLEHANAYGVADAVRIYMDDPGLTKRVSDANRKRAWEKYESNAIARDLENYYGKVAGLLQ